MSKILSHVSRFNMVCDATKLLMGLLTILTSVTLFIKSGDTLEVMVIGFSILAILNGFYNFIHCYQTEHVSQQLANIFVGVSVADIIVGILLIFNLNASKLVTVLLLSVWFIGDAAINLSIHYVNGRQAKKRSWKLQMIGYGVCLFIGILMLLSPIFSALSLTVLSLLYLVLTGSEKIFSAFSYNLSRFKLAVSQSK
ncbi:HdeD family acid-resistance protein [Vagococcus acidifermentans]|uniref:Acid-resistance membrane protein n=1 Tax=Vagococcus acidifermentans TaxID=564710 RepID=A0A430ALY1_9ENTE|nr:DUF308 domain-containing protein [Vagococcus acidifermentans]RSU09150.1 hypothetical protein CBF27_13245 [Vagococcus acidifermentans]